MRGYFRHIGGTLAHKAWVAYYLAGIIARLAWRALAHDASKLTAAEAAGFARVIGDLKDSEYGSQAYRENLRVIRPVVDRHQRANRHHPECHAAGLYGMDLVDLTEMLCDWRAAVRRHKTGSIVKSLAINRARFEMADQLAEILHNTVKNGRKL